MSTQLYRCFNGNNELLYVGISVNFGSRLKERSQVSAWFDDVSTVTIEKFDTRALALDAEAIAIRTEAPKHNLEIPHLGRSGDLTVRKDSPWHPRKIWDPMKRQAMLTLLDDIIAELPMPDALRRQFQAVAHKIRYPMADILAKVYGDTLSERARRIGVSRQTLYVWANERFRPTPTQARAISDLTGVPIAHITDDGFEVDHDTERKATRKAVRMAELAERAQKRVGRIGREKRRVVDVQGRDRKARKVPKRGGS